ncbi:hypothetical protein C0J52_22434 [Blattella germanica]|nr:hypothetical protein C0J52_22434 [Blattella germanica]
MILNLKLFGLNLKLFILNLKVFSLILKLKRYRRADIVAIDKSNKKAFVLDPTIRFEINTTQAEKVDKEKRSIYEPCLPYLSKHYQINLNQWTVIGLLFGCRAAVTKYTWQNLKPLGISQEVLHNITISIIKNSFLILHHHLYHAD